MKRLLKRLSQFFVFVFKMLAYGYEYETEEPEKGGNTAAFSKAERNHTYNRSEEKEFEKAFIAESLFSMPRGDVFLTGIGKKDGYDELIIIPEYLPEPDS